MCRNLEYSERLREKEKVGGMPAKLNEKKSNRQLEREIKDKGDIFLLEEQRENFVTAVEKKEMLAVTKVKMSGSQKMNKNTYDHFLHKTCNQEVSCFSRAKQRQRTAQKSVLHVQSCFFAN